ncbi:MAG: DUF2141 domain-containing protein [Massilia sp.]|jgi:uncharacterized protein (DUF2141 family)|uniref:Uncharacterized protein (DUF2141 family) n=1 Tax=Massilia aurea TaxID=373040 RepID=A0A7X0CGD1_9BURK|nr:DUF2141 domain-containing protein [Massilia aurea]MBB6136211.1 uncharacterized protein (DUF2141 family) [Massilia aurea]MBD8632978.1 DUF2141 domain-containing protein [Oxalobacteraceae sp. CFBP 8755]MBD8722063.1 DUF2141 domain-containing protein [Oxalobacteraceae sp. CFBP 13708]
MQSTFRTLALAAAFCAAGSASAASIEVRVQGVTAKGKVLVAVCDKTTFLKDCAYSGSAPAKAGETVVTVDGVPTGSWAVLSYQDENDNGKLDRNVLGIPKEPYAFSRDARGRFGPPSFEDAAFELRDEKAVTTIKLR